MKIIESAAGMQETCRQIRRSGRTIAFVPTMGFLHEGHLSLIRLGRSRADVVAVSIFVNPVQFGPKEDLAKYPRDQARDTRLCEKEGVDLLFRPAAETMYAPNHSVYVEETEISRSLCGLSRPGHFRGVTTVVAKLFNIVQPDVAVFGQKDAQQARIIQKMTRELNFPVEIVVAPTVREPDGLAMSSRNVYLSAGDRSKALCLSRSLELAGRLYEKGERNAAEIRKQMRSLIGKEGGVEIDYIEILDCVTWKPAATVKDGTVVAVAVRIGGVRLIDNTLIGSGAALPAL